MSVLARWRLVLIVLGAVALAAPILLYAISAGWIRLPINMPGVSPSNDDYARVHNHPAAVRRAIDGQTIVVVLSGSDSEETVHLRGLAAPLPGAEFFGTQSAAIVGKLVEGQTVRLVLDRDGLRDSRGRWLAYVYLADGTMLNERILQAGAAYADTRVDHPLMGRFKQIEKHAAKAKVGLWENVRADQLPDWRPDLRHRVAAASRAE